MSKNTLVTTNHPTVIKNNLTKYEILTQGIKCFKAMIDKKP